jgi:hypothetical protein
MSHNCTVRSTQHACSLSLFWATFQHTNFTIHFEDSNDGSDKNFGFARSGMPKRKGRSSKAKATPVRSQLKKKDRKAQRSKSPKGSPREKGSSNEKDIQAKKFEVDGILVKLEQINPKTLWNRTLTEKEIGVRLHKATTLLHELGQIEPLEGLKNELEQRVRSIESHKSMVSQLLSWTCNLEEPFLLSAAFVQFFKDLDNNLQQIVVIHIGTKLLEVEFEFEAF